MTIRELPAPRIPSATYRLQLNHLFGFRDSLRLIPMLHEIGITDLYVSPIFKASPKSLHGYNVIDSLVLNPEIGTEEEFRLFAEALKKQGMGLILDIVPNHMGIDSPENSWWMDVLENGPSSMYAGYFDINWHPVKKELDNRILLPVLGDQYGNVLDRGELKLVLEEGSLFITYYENRFPLRPRSYLNVLGFRIGRLHEQLTADSEDRLEYLSILTQIRHLPLYTSTDSASTEELHREMGVVKKRIGALRKRSAAIAAFMDENIRILNGEPGNPASFNLLDRLLELQIYRLAYWRVATEEINYRRFFDINQLAAICNENRRVFRDYHRLVFRLVREGIVTGLRVDHPDGLYHPTNYFRRLQEESFIQLLRQRNVSDGEAQMRKWYREAVGGNPGYRPMYVVGEKILVKEEKMPEDWPIFGTTGYNFLNLVNGVFVESANAARFRSIYSTFSGEFREFSEIVYESKKLIMGSMASEINMLGDYLNRISEKDRHTRDFTLNSLTSALTEIIAVFPVYRTYIYNERIDERDRMYVEQAVANAKRKNPAITPSVFDFVADVLLLRFPEGLSPADCREWTDFVLKFQQLTGPFMAKGMEDTAFYVYNPLVSLNDVGGSPDVFGVTIEQFHERNAERLRMHPHTMAATSTHDTKRNEDVRARINVLSEMPETWDANIRRWSSLNAERRVLVKGRAVPSANEEYLLYQTMIGFSPVGPVEEKIFETYRQRLKDYMLKAVREAKITTSWINPDDEYENALMAFIDAIIAREPSNTFLYEFEQFIRKIEPYGLFNSLSQLLLKITSPGVPDFYQGTIVWNFRLVDPDNRWPVDYDMRFRLLREVQRSLNEEPLPELIDDLVTNMRDGRIKLYVTLCGLNYRRDNRDLFDSGEYHPVEGVGEHGLNICAFARRTERKLAVTVVPRFLTSVTDSPHSLFLGDSRWQESYLILRVVPPGTTFRNVFTGETVVTMPHRMGSALFIGDVLRTFPVALLERVDN